MKYCQKIGDEGLVEVGAGCPLLQALHLVDCAGIGDIGVGSIALGCPLLRRLHVRRCYKVSLLPPLFLPFCDPLLLQGAGECKVLKLGRGR